MMNARSSMTAAAVAIAILTGCGNAVDAPHGTPVKVTPSATFKPAPKPTGPITGGGPNPSGTASFPRGTR